MKKEKNVAVVLPLTVAILFVSTSCEKLNINRLRANYYFSRANGEFTEGYYRKAIEEYERALSYNPDLVEAYRFLGESYKNLYKPAVDNPENNERAEKALAALLKAYEINPNNKDIIYSLGDMYDKLRNFEEAEKMYLKIIDMEPTNMSNYYVAAEFYKRYAGEAKEGEEAQQVGKSPFEKAEEMYLRRLETDPENEQGYAYIAQFYEGISPVPEFDKAYEYQRRRVDLDPESAEAWLSVGVNRWSKAYRLQNALSRQERMTIARVAEEALLKANELNPSYPEPYSWLSVLYASVLAKIDPDRAARYEDQAARYLERFKDARQREADRKKLEEDLGKLK